MTTTRVMVFSFLLKNQSLEANGRSIFLYMEYVVLAHGSVSKSCNIIGECTQCRGQAMLIKSQRTPFGIGSQVHSSPGEISKVHGFYMDGAEHYTMTLMFSEMILVSVHWCCETTSGRIILYLMKLLMQI